MRVSLLLWDKATYEDNPLQRITSVLFCLFCIAYPIAVAGVAFDVPPTFSMTWTGSALLILEGMLLERVREGQGSYSPLFRFHRLLEPSVS